MRTGLLLLLLTAVLPGQSPLALLTDFERPASERAVVAMHEEVARIMGPLGWQPEWHALEEAPSTLPLFVILSFKGVCRVQTGFSQDPDSLTLASTEVSGTHVLPFSSVECNKVRSLLPGLRWDRESETVLGRALGRVIVHELYHFLLQTRKHAAKGIANAFQTSRELTAAEFRFDELSSFKLRDSAVPRPIILEH
ncbi:MAG: hypothetical protein JWO80_6368 [Bryobacterales bacterium]|nr:hypothetical protein [Bryobacterales bacterium]